MAAVHAMEQELMESACERMEEARKLQVEVHAGPQTDEDAQNAQLGASVTAAEKQKSEAWSGGGPSTMGFSPPLGGWWLLCEVI